MLIKYIIALFISLSFLLQLYAQSDEVYICMIFKGDDHFNDGIYIDENLDIDIGLKEEKLKEIAFKKSGKEWFDGQLIFENNRKEFSDFTKLKTGDEFYLSFQDKVVKAPVSFYSIWNEPYSGYELHPAFDLPNTINLPSKDYDKNIIICTNKSKCSTINYLSETDENIIIKIKNSMADFTNNLPVSDGMPDEETSYVIMKGSFTSKIKTEYAVSVVKRRSFENFASGIFIVDENGKILINVVPFTKTDFYYSKLNAIVDYNGDGKYELLIENGYYEGLGYELWKYSGNVFTKVTTGFYWGV